MDDLQYVHVPIRQDALSEPNQHPTEREFCEDFVSQINMNIVPHLRLTDERYMCQVKLEVVTVQFRKHFDFGYNDVEPCRVYVMYPYSSAVCCNYETFCG